MVLVGVDDGDHSSSRRIETATSAASGATDTTAQEEQGNADIDEDCCCLVQKTNTVAVLYGTYAIPARTVYIPEALIAKASL